MKVGELNMTIEIGKQVADFILPNQQGEKISLSDFKGKNIVLYFYPKGMTPGCTTQACDFRDQHENFKNIDAVILGVSPDPAERHQKFIDKHELPFHLLADEDDLIAEEFGVWKLTKNYGDGETGVECV